MLAQPITNRAEDTQANDAANAAQILADLEARAPKDWRDQKLIDEVNARLIGLIELNGLTTADEFHRAATLARWDLGEFRIGRMHYELLLTAAAKNDLRAEVELAMGWDSLMRLLGRPLRIDIHGTVAANPDFSQLEPAPDCIQAVLRDPAGARAKLATATDNNEINTLVDADQAVRKTNWSTLTEEERKANMSGDRQRNVRMIEIVRAGDVHTANDFARASLVMQHSPQFSGYQLAHELAVCSMLLGDRSFGRWLVTATYDRMLRSVGHDQRFGTQMGPTGPLRIDESGICDAERRALGCPTLAEARAETRQTRGPSLVARRKQMQVGPDNSIRDPANGVSAMPPTGWTIIRANQLDEQTTSISFAIPEHAGSSLGLYYRIQSSPEPSEGPEALLRMQAQAKETDRQTTFPDYKNRPDSFVFRQVNGQPCLSWIADCTKDGQRWSEYLARVLGKGGYALFFLQIPAGELDALRPAVDGMVSTLQLP